MKKILIADDDEDVRMMTTCQLESCGYETVTAADGRDALEKTARWRPDLVLLDIMMPEIHGFAVCHRIKTDEALKSTKVLMFSVKNFPADRRQAQEAGADGFLCKPSESSGILQSVHALLNE